MSSKSNRTRDMPTGKTCVRLAGCLLIGTLLTACGGSDSKDSALDGVITASEATFGSTTETRVLAAPPVVVAEPRKLVPAMPYTVQHKAGSKMQDKKCMRHARISSLSGKPPVGVTTRASIRSDACAVDSAD